MRRWLQTSTLEQEGERDVWDPGAADVPEGEENVREGLRAVLPVSCPHSSVFMASISLGIDVRVVGFIECLLQLL